MFEFWAQQVPPTSKYHHDTLISQQIQPQHLSLCLNCSGLINNWHQCISHLSESNFNQEDRGHRGFGFVGSLFIAKFVISLLNLRKGPDPKNRGNM